MLSAAASAVGWCRVMSAVTYWGLEVNDWPATSVAPALMQFLAVAGEVTVAAPVLLADAAPSLPAANTERKSCSTGPPQGIGDLVHED